MLKRAFDLIVSLLALILLLPLLGLIALAMRLTLGSPVLFRQQRPGLYGQPFTIYKFRTMVADADRLGPWITSVGDSRIPRVGRLLRRTKIDELPQLINVLRDEMSLVGPRPEDPRYAALYTPEQRRVLAVCPGITSPASVRYRHEEQLLSLCGPDWEQVYVRQVMPDKLQIELDYLAQRTLWSDLGVIFQTLGALFRQ